MKNTVVIINKSESTRLFVRDVLRGAGYDTVEAKDIDSVISTIGEKNVSYIVSDVFLPGISGIEQVSVKSLFARRICHG
jgi:DNA-binding NtrC family response regulator